MLRQVGEALEAARVAALSVREKPLVSLSVGMSALSVVLVLIILMGVYNRQQLNRSTRQRQRQLAAAAARAHRRAAQRNQRSDQLNSIGTQVTSPYSDSDAPTPVEIVITPATHSRPVEVSSINIWLLKKILAFPISCIFLFDPTY